MNCTFIKYSMSEVIIKWAVCFISKAPSEVMLSNVAHSTHSMYAINITSIDDKV